MANKKAALIYIGQTPRKDITPEMKDYLNGICDVTEIGVLDPFSPAEIDRMNPCSDDRVLITKRKDGQTVYVDEDIIRKLMAETVEKIYQQGFDACAVMCTGSFPDLPQLMPLVTSDEAFHQNLNAGAGVQCIGVIVPTQGQEKPFAALYQKTGKKILTAHASPYEDIETIVAAGRKLMQQGAECICLDCMGYSGRIAQRVSTGTGLPCYVPREEIAKQIIHLFQK